uniref:C2H2-type domain-containing protein n=1 Tax=Knipowitschia caucasica TaxID=637954 RepID=A0AAV2M819_KNICA
MNGKHSQEEVEDPNEELYTTIKIMASEGGKPKGPDVRLGINQHYPSFKPPPFPYHSRSHASVASATNFTTHNIPQTFSTAIRCTKCGNSFDNMPELHQHILACANASDKKRYTPKKNPIPLKEIVKSPNGVVSPSAAAGQGAFRRMGQPKRLNFNTESGKTKMSALSRKKNQLVQKAISQKNKFAPSPKTSPVKAEEELVSPNSNICPHCSREFTYNASLTKHCLNCPMKPVVKKGKKSAAAEVKKERTATPVTDKTMSLRKKAAEPEPLQTEPEAKPLGKTRARSSGAAEPEPTQTSKGKGGPGRPKRPASLSEAKPPALKKAKKGSPQSAAPPAIAEPPVDPSQKPATSKPQPKGKDTVPKKPAELKTPPVKKERFSLRSRSGGPITRSSQATSPGNAEEQASDEPKDTVTVVAAVETHLLQ